MNENRNFIINELILNGFLFTGNFEESHYYFADEDRMVCYVTPHSGTDNMHMIRAEMRDDFDKWGNAQYEELFSDTDELIGIINSLKQINFVVDEE